MTVARETPAIWIKAVLGIALGGGGFALSASLFSPAGADAIVEPARISRPPLPDPTPGQALEALQEGRAQPQSRMESKVSSNPFAALNLQAPTVATVGSAPTSNGVATKPAKPRIVPVHIPSAPPVPPEPTAPPLPFEAIGSILGTEATGGQTVAFLQQQQSLLVVRKGETIGQGYRVEAITSEKVEFIYLPLNQRQSLSLAR